MPTPTSKYRLHYYPFGSSLNTRSFSAGSGFRFGFNGKEKENNIIVNGYTFEFRIYNSGLGRFLSTDPIAKIYPWQTPFAYYCNSPISIIDYLGLGQPNWYHNNSNKTKREIKKFRNILSKEDRTRMDKIEKMVKSAAKTKEVDEFMSHLSETYKNDKRFYRSYVDDKSTGHNSIVMMSSIWAYNIDPKRVDKTEEKTTQIKWDVNRRTINNNIINYENKGNIDVAIIIRSATSNPDGKFKGLLLNIELDDSDRKNVFSIEIDHVQSTKPILIKPNEKLKITIADMPKSISNGSSTISFWEYISAQEIEHGRHINPIIQTPQSIKEYVKGIKD